MISLPRLSLNQSEPIPLRLRAFRRFLTMVCASLLLLAASGCAKRFGANLGTLNIASFAATQPVLSPGQSTTLVWSETGAITLSLTGGSSTTLMPVSSNSVSVSPAATTTYTLTATDGQGNTMTAMATVTVVPLPVIASFTASPALISNGESSLLEWAVTGAATVTLDNGIGPVTGDNYRVTPTTTTTYTLTVTSPSGAVVTAQTTVSVVLKPIIAGFSASPAVIGPNQSSTLSWSVVGATAVSIDQGIGPVSNTTGSVQVSPTQATTYTLTATNSLGGFSVSVTAKTTVKVSATPAPFIASFNASAPSVSPGTAVTLTAVFTPADGSAKAAIDQGIGSVESGVPVDTKPLAASTTYTLTVTNSTGTATSQVRVLAGDVALFAGLPTHAGYQDGQGKNAFFTEPNGIAADGAGNLYVADSGNDVVRVITRAGVVSTLAGNPDIAGSQDGVGALTEFNNPYGIAVDSTGNVYVSDTGNATIRMITPAGKSTTIAGIVGTLGFQDGPALEATFGSPEGISIDASGNLFIADSLNCNIRELTVAGMVSTIAGPTSAGLCGYQDGVGSAAKFDIPSSVAVDGKGNVFVADQNNQTIREVSPLGLVTTVAGTAGMPGSSDGVGGAASFTYPDGVAVDAAGNLYVADTGNYTIRKIAGGVVSTIVGQAGTPDASLAGGPLPSQIAAPHQIVIDPLSGKQYFTMADQAIASAPF